VNHTTSYADCNDVEAERNDRIERHEIAVRTRIESDPERLADAVCDYWTGTVFRCDGPETLTAWTLALAGAESALNAVCRGDAIPADELRAFRALLMAVETAKDKQAKAVQDAVDMEVAA
jgi:hypothetical protein